MSPLTLYASGIAVHDDVVHTFDKIRVRLQGADKQEQLKLVLFKISDDGKCIIVDEEKCLKVKDLNGEEDVFRKIVNMMPTDDCRYALYDCSWESKDSPKEDLVFIMWAPEHSTIKKKMKYASSKQYIKAKFQGKSLGVFQKLSTSSPFHNQMGMFIGHQTEENGLKQGRLACQMRYSHFQKPSIT
ncbi:unnamed protein product [Oncorhynchus mykiss]|uniref:ADF-H domain-containing protein n=1 Tax=Oncorhynchus mykiss TaxID=8022 RepID=A0A060Y1P8_ONCMY|nr:unnamed protein product [Oncorhynchus mykiss]